MYPLFSLSYWTSLLPPPTFDPLFINLTVGLFGCLILAGIVLLYLAKRFKRSAFWGKAAPKIASMTIWMGVLGFIHLWIAYEQTYLWGARFWLLVWGLGLLAWIGYLVNYILRVLPKTEEEYEEKMRIKKYLPKYH